MRSRFGTVLAVIWWRPWPTLRPFTHQTNVTARGLVHCGRGGQSRRILRARQALLPSQRRSRFQTADRARADGLGLRTNVTTPCALRRSCHRRGAESRRVGYRRRGARYGVVAAFDWSDVTERTATSVGQGGSKARSIVVAGPRDACAAARARRGWRLPDAADEADRCCYTRERRRCSLGASEFAPGLRRDPQPRAPTSLR